MSYKYKPNKSMLKRFRVTKTGKVKRAHALTSHLRSGRSSKRLRQLTRPAIMCESIASNVRLAMGLSHKNPKKVAHQRALKAQALAKAKTAEAAKP